MFPYEAHAGHPVSLTSAAYNANAGELTLTFSSALDGELNPWFLFIRDGATASTGGFILSTEHSNSPASSSYTYHFSVAHRAAIAAMSDPHLHHSYRGGHGGGLYDNQHSVAVAEFTADISVTADTTKPTLHATTAPAYDPDTGVLTLTLAEPVKAADADVDQSKIHINNSSTASGGTSLNGATVSSTGNGATVTITTTQAQRATVSGYETPHVYFTASAVTDLSNNANAASSTAKALAIKPQLSFGKSGLADDGALTIGFQRAVKSADADVDQSKIHVRDGSGTTGGTALAGSAVTSTGDSKRIAITPTAAQRAAILGYAEPHVYFTAGAVTSSTDVAIPASSASAPLSRQPELASAAVDLNGFSQTVASQTGHYAGKLTLTFSEAVEAHTSEADTLPKITVREQDDSPTLTLDATSEILTASDTSVVIALSPAQKEEVKAMSGGLEVLIAAQAFKSSLSSLPQRAVGEQDAASQIASQNVTQDATGPVAASVSVDEGTGILTLTFDEHVKDGEVDLAKIYVANDPFTTGGTALTGSAVTSSASTDAQVTVKLSEALRKAVIGYAAPHIRFDLGAVKDLGNRDMAASASAEIDDLADTTAPTLATSNQDRPALDEGTGILTLTFSESVKEGSDVDLEKIFVTGSATASGGTALSISGDTSVVTSTVDTDSEITIKLREAARLAAIGYATPHVYFASGAVKDLSDQNIAASTVAAEIADTADDDPPKVASASLDEGTGILTIAFDETVDVSSADGAKFKIREGANAGSSGEVALSNAEITAGQSDGTALTFGLTEDSRQGAIALNVPYLYAEAGAITDVVSPTANSIAADTDGKIVGLTPDGAAPTIVSAEATALDKITVTFSETVKTADTAGEGWSISGTDAGSLQVSQNSSVSSGSTTVVLTLSADLPGTGPDIALRYETSGTDVGSDVGSGSGAVTDTSNNALAAISSVTVSDGISPSVSSAKYISRNSVVITFSEPVKLASGATAPVGWTVSGADSGTATAASSFGTVSTSVAVSSDTLTLNNDLADKTRLDFTLSYASGNLEDAAGNDLKAYSEKPSDGIRPVIVSAESGELNQITVTFSEAVTATGTAGAGGWSLSGADSGSLLVSSRSDLSSHSSELTLMLSGNLNDPIGTVTLGYNAGAGDAKDRSDNALASQTVVVSQDLPPTIESAKATALNKITVTFSEAVQTADTSGAGWSVSGTDAPSLQVTGSTAIPSPGSTTVELTLSGNLADTKPDGVLLRYETSGTDVPGDQGSGSGAIVDASSKALAARANVVVSDGVKPQIVSASITGPNEITITYSEAVTAAQSDYASVLIVTARTISTLSGGTTNTHTLTFSGAGAGSEATGSVTLDATRIRDAASNALGTSASLSRSLADGQTSDISSAVLDMQFDNPRLVLSFDGPVDQSSFDPTKIFVTNSTPQKTRGSVDLSLAPTFSGNEVTIGIKKNIDGRSSLTDIENEYDGIIRLVSGYRMEARAGAWTEPGGASNAAGMYSVEYRTGTSSSLTSFEPRKSFTAALGANDRFAVTADDGSATEGFPFKPLRNAWTGHVFLIQDGAVVADKREYGSTQLVGGAYPNDLLVATAAFDLSVLDRTKDTTVRVEYHPSSWLCVESTTCLAEVSSRGYVAEKTVGYQEISIPQLSSARIGDGMLVLGFDVDMDVELSDLTKASVREKGTTSPVVELANLTLTSGQSDSTILVDLGTNLDGVQSMTQPELVLQSAAFSAGPSRETEAATADIAKDATAPSVSSVTVTSRTTVEVQFSERVRLANTGTAPFGWTISGADAESRQVSSISGITTGSVTYSAMLTLDGSVADSTKPRISVAYSGGNIEDMAGNALAAYTATPAGDGIAPTFTAKATAPDKITVTFSEDLSVSDETARGWSVSGTDAPSHTVDSSTPVSEGSSVVLTLSSDLADTRPDGVVLRYEVSGTDVGSDAGSGSGTVQDPSSNAMEPATATVSDGLAPAVSSSKYVSRTSVEVTFSEPVRLGSGSVPSGWTVSGTDKGDATGASAAAGLPTSDSAPTATLTLDNNLADKTNLDFTLSYASGNLEDVSGNSLSSYSANPSDGIAPTIVSAESRALNEITVVFSEAVSATSTGASATWQLSGSGLPAGVTVSGNPAISSSHTVLRLSGNLGAPIGAVELAYVESAGDVQDGSSNALAAQSVSVSQNLIPMIVSAKITGPNQATITYNEPVTASSGAYSGLTVGAARTVTSYTQTSAAAHVLVFDGPAAGTGASGTVTIDQSKISDGVLNLGTSSVQRNLTDGQAPTFTANVTDSRTVTVAFSEQVSSSDNAASHWTLSGADAQAVSSASALSNSGTMTIEVGSDFAANVADLKISYSAAGTVSDAAGNVLAAVSSAAVSDDQRPSIASAVARTDNSITVTLTRNSSGSATDAGTTWTLSGTDAAGLSVSGYLGVSSDMVTLALSGNLPDTAPDLSLSYDSSVGDIADSAGKRMIDQTVPVSDGLKPRIDGAALNEGTGVLTVTFTEQVSVDSGLHLRESGSAGGIPLPSASGTVLSFTLSEAQRQQALAFATPSLRMEAGAAADGAGLSSEAADVPVSATADAVPPVAGSAFLDLGTGILVISFDENLGPAADPSPLSISGSLAGAQVSVSGSTATVTLTEQQRQAAIGQPSPSLVLGAGAFRDVSGTGSAPATLPLRTAPDDDRPGLVTAALNTDTSTLVLEFDETMDASAFGAQLSHVRITGGAQEIQVSGTVSRDGVKVRVQVDRNTLNAVLDSISASLRLETRGAQFEDTSGNAAPQADVELAIGDDSPPRLVSASVISPDTVLAVFHEDLDGSTVQPSDFEVGGLAPVSVSEERGTVTLKLDAEYDERSSPTVSLTGPVSDLFGNAQSSGSVQSVNNIVRVAISEFKVSASGGLAVAGEQISISFRATEPVQNPALSINGEAVPVTPAENGFTASYVVPPGSPQGPLSVSLSIESMTGTPASFTERDLTAPNVSVDTVVPAVASASSSGVDSVTVRYSEPVLADASGASVEVSSVTYPVSVSGSGSETVLVYWDGDGSVPESAVLRGLAVRDIAGNPGPAGHVSAGPATDSASPGPTGVMPIAKGTTLRTVTVPAGTEPALELSSASATDPRVLFAGGRTAAFENPLSVITREPGLPDLFFQAGTEVGGLAGLTVAGADLEAAVLIAPSDYEVPSGSPELDEYPQLRNPATAVLVGSPASDIAFSKPVRIEFDVPLSGLVFSVGSAGTVLPIPACAEGYGGAVPLLQEAPDAWPPETYDPLACVSEDSVWTMHFSVFGVAHRVSGGSECDDCTPPTLGYDAYGARLVGGGFAYNGLASDVEYFFTPYPLIESEVGKQNTVSLKIYENEGPRNIQHVSIAFGLRSGEVISESKAVINYDILHDGTGALSVIDPENVIGDSLSASHEIVECAAGSSLECLSVTVSHSFRAPLEFDIVGTDVWDSQRNSWQNYFNHGLRITGESMNPVPGVAVNGGNLVLHPIVEGSNNIDVMAGEDGALYRLSPDGIYEPLRNISSLFHSIDESMYTYRGAPMQGYDRSDPEFAAAVDEQIALAKAVLEQMNLGRQGWQEGFDEAEQSVHVAIDRLELLRADIAAERQRAEQVFLDRYGPTDRPE